MTQLILQPAVGAPAPVNIQKSIAKTIKIDSLLILSPAERAVLHSASPTGSVGVWGGRTNDPWKHMLPGDVVLFLTGPNGKVAYSGVVAAMMDSEAVANAVWGEACKEFRYVYFLRDVQPRNFTRAAINELLQNKSLASQDNWVGTRRVKDTDAAARVFASLNIPQKLNEGDLETDSVIGLSDDDAKDGLRLAKFRKEQKKLKDALFLGKLVLPCAVCGDEFPRGFLVAAHLKKRSECSNAERINSAVVLPMCTLGCDALYEHGLLSLDPKSRSVISTGKTKSVIGTALGSQTTKLIGRASSYYALDKSTVFLDWHQKANVAAP